MQKENLFFFSFPSVSNLFKVMKLAEYKNKAGLRIDTKSARCSAGTKKCELKKHEACSKHTPQKSSLSKRFC